MNKQRTRVICDGVSFDIGRLDLNASCKGFELVVKTIGPGLVQLTTDRASGAVALMSQAGSIPDLLNLFAPVCKVSRDPAGAYGDFGEASYVELKPFLEMVFSGRLDLAVLFIAECVRIEYSHFLESVQSGALATLLAKLA